MTHNSPGLVASVVGAVVALTLGALSCDDKVILEPDCVGCLRYHLTETNSGTLLLLRDIFFVDSANGWAVGDDGVIVHSGDGGLTWSTQHQGVGGRLWSVHFPAPDSGYVVGEDDLLFRTSDGGDLWTDRPTIGFNLTDVYMFDSRNGLAVGRDDILKTIDAAASWDIYLDEDDFVSSLYSVTFADRNHGWAVGGGANKILITLNGGGTWDPVPNPTGQILMDVTFVNSSHGWAVGVGGTIVHTADGGATWTKQTVGTSGTLHGVDFWDTDNGVVVGDGGEVFTTTNGGDTWEQRLTGTVVNLFNVSFVNASTFVICGEAGMLLRFTYSWDDCCQ